MFLVTGARGREANYQPFIVGERASGMGGAVVATADGMDACFYNPAGLGDEKRDSLSVNGTLYGIQNFKSKDPVFPGEDFSISSFMTIPTGLSTVRRLKEGTVVAFSVFVPSQLNVREIQAFPEHEHYYNYSVDEQMLQLGPSIGHVVNEKLSVGASIFGIYQTASKFENVYLGDYSFLYSGNYKYSVAGLIGTVGFQYRFADEWSLGVTFTTPTATLYGKGRAHLGEVLGSEEGVASKSEYYESLDADNGLPARMRVGLGWQRPDVGSAGFDVTHHFSRSYTWLEGSQNGETVLTRKERQAVTDINLGGEVILQKRYPLRAGFFTSFSSAPDIDLEVPSVSDRIDLYGVTASVGVIGENVILNFGLSYVLGDGDTAGTQMNEAGEVFAAITKTSERSLYAFASTTYRF